MEALLGSCAGPQDGDRAVSPTRDASQGYDLKERSATTWPAVSTDCHLTKSYQLRLSLLAMKRTSARRRQGTRPLSQPHRFNAAPSSSPNIPSYSATNNSLPLQSDLGNVTITTHFQTDHKVPIPRLQRPGSKQAASGSDRQRVSHACEPCRRRKSKCDGLQPPCGRCRDQEIHCYYEDGKREKLKRQRRFAEEDSLSGEDAIEDEHSVLVSTTSPQLQNCAQHNAIVSVGSAGYLGNSSVVHWVEEVMMKLATNKLVSKSHDLTPGALDSLASMADEPSLNDIESLLVHDCTYFANDITQVQGLWDFSVNWMLPSE
ncbi:hypothetical protein CIHG_00340 [Coccidioides immitis H538.4]|uniref:Zn(2)-C6 fungal-type domain-containing protein n=1 Tax=Coccidioides immitis H538.4 TaxID=396776 RepID=A0A0J8RF20_COCIT|nr:hypothetical protein CIHG_00340 [Coccidioides immitis H538.4]